MTPKNAINISGITPKQKNDLLGIFQDYLYFIRGLEITLQHNNTADLAYMFIKDHQWESASGQVIPWNIEYTNFYEAGKYKEFVSGVKEVSGMYTYISLVHTKEENDVKLPQVKYYPDNYDVNSIDLDLPCLVEQYNVGYIPGQKMKDAVLLIDGKFRALYKGKKYQDIPVNEALNNHDMQAEFRVLLNIVDYFDNNRNNIDHKYEESELHIKLANVMSKIIATESLSGFENRILDLLGAYSDKTQEIIRNIFPKMSTLSVWKEAEKAHLINSAEIMHHYMNIRHFMRHQWDSLEGLGKFTARTSKKYDEIRREYKSSYGLFFDKTITERVKEYQKAAEQMQTILKVMYPNFLVREVGESNSKFVSRLKEWKKENPDSELMVCTNYPLISDKHKSLVNSLNKVLSQTQILDHLDRKDLVNYEEKENKYFLRSRFLSLYNHIETDMMSYCFYRGLEYNRNETWNYFKKHILSRKQYDTWCEYRKLRNNLSHNHLDEELSKELIRVTKGKFNKDVYDLSECIHSNSPTFTKQDDGLFLGVHNDGLCVRIDVEKHQILSREYKDSSNKKLSPHDKKYERKTNPDTNAKAPVNLPIQKSDFEY